MVDETPAPSEEPVEVSPEETTPDPFAPRPKSFLQAALEQMDAGAKQAASAVSTTIGRVQDIFEQRAPIFSFNRAPDVSTVARSDLVTPLDPSVPRKLVESVPEFRVTSLDGVEDPKLKSILVTLRGDLISAIHKTDIFVSKKFDTFYGQLKVVDTNVSRVSTRLLSLPNFEQMLQRISRLEERKPQEVATPTTPQKVAEDKATPQRGLLEDVLLGRGAAALIGGAGALATFLSGLVESAVIGVGLGGLASEAYEHIRRNLEDNPKGGLTGAIALYLEQELGSKIYPHQDRVDKSLAQLGKDMVRDENEFKKQISDLTKYVYGTWDKAAKESHTHDEERKKWLMEKTLSEATIRRIQAQADRIEAEQKKRNEKEPRDAKTASGEPGLEKGWSDPFEMLTQGLVSGTEALQKGGRYLKSKAPPELGPAVMATGVASVLIAKIALALTKTGVAQAVATKAATAVAQATTGEALSAGQVSAIASGSGVSAMTLAGALMTVGIVVGTTAPLKGDEPEFVRERTQAKALSDEQQAQVELAQWAQQNLGKKAPRELRARAGMLQKEGFIEGVKDWAGSLAETKIGPTLLQEKTTEKTLTDIKPEPLSQEKMLKDLTPSTPIGSGIIKLIKEHFGLEEVRAGSPAAKAIKGIETTDTARTVKDITQAPVPFAPGEIKTLAPEKTVKSIDQAVSDAEKGLSTKDAGRAASDITGGQFSIPHETGLIHKSAYKEFPTWGKTTASSRGGIQRKGEDAKPGDTWRYAKIYPVARNERTGEWAFGVEGMQDTFVYGMPNAMRGLIDHAISGYTFVGDVMQGKADPNDVVRQFDFLTIPFLAIDFMGIPEAALGWVHPTETAGITRMLLGGGAEDYVRGLRAMKDFLLTKKILKGAAKPERLPIPEITKGTPARPGFIQASYKPGEDTRGAYAGGVGPGGLGGRPTTPVVPSRDITTRDATRTAQDITAPTISPESGSTELQQAAATERSMGTTGAGILSDLLRGGPNALVQGRDYPISPADQAASDITTRHAGRTSRDITGPTYTAPGGPMPAEKIDPHQIIADVSTGKISPNDGSVKVALSMLGKQEGRDQEQIIKFLHDGGQNFHGDAWCADFVNASLAQAGISGSGSAMARSFHKWGEAVTDPKNIHAGDVVVRGNSHVMMATGDAYQDNGQWMIPIVGGNQGGPGPYHRMVTTKAVPFSGMDVREASPSYYTKFEGGKPIVGKGGDYGGGGATGAYGSIIRAVDAGKGFTKVEYADGRVEMRKGDFAWRNNNPGNIEAGEFASAHGALPGGGRFALFPTREAGEAARAALLFEGKNYKNLSILDAMKRYAPSTENNPEAYAQRLAAAAGVSVDTRMSDLNPKQRMALLTEQKKVEGNLSGSVTVEREGQRGPTKVASERFLRTGAAPKQIDWTTAPIAKPSTMPKTDTQPQPVVPTEAKPTKKDDYWGPEPSWDASKLPRGEGTSPVTPSAGPIKVSFRPGEMPQAKVAKEPRLGGATDKSPYQMLSDISTGQTHPTDKSVQAILDHMNLKGGADREVMKAFLQTGSAPVDPAKQAWCASTINAALAAGGIEGTGSPLASSFHKWGEKVTDPSKIQKGDIVITQKKLGASGAGDHVMIATGPSFPDPITGEMMIPTAGGNQGVGKGPAAGVVSESKRKASEMDVRRAPGETTRGGRFALPTQEAGGVPVTLAAYHPGRDSRPSPAKPLRAGTSRPIPQGAAPVYPEHDTSRPIPQGAKPVYPEHDTSRPVPHGAAPVYPEHDTSMPSLAKQPKPVYPDITPPKPYQGMMRKQPIMEPPISAQAASQTAGSGTHDWVNNRANKQAGYHGMMRNPNASSEHPDTWRNDAPAHQGDGAKGGHNADRCWICDP